mmetsp:Transcript_29924/g.61811  ORF Transcript_29924/g.61811 Transcript_29924/m.61811 type:complete len:120 (+) Transcript_29924:22-381(+)
MATDEESSPYASTKEDSETTTALREAPTAPNGNNSDVMTASSSCSDLDGKESKVFDEYTDADAAVPETEAKDSKGADSTEAVNVDTLGEGAVPVATGTVSHGSEKILGANRQGAREVVA